MNEQAIQDAYDLFVGQGYSKGINDFRTLLSSNPQALDDAFGLFKSNGYTKTVDDFKTLMGVSASAEPLKKNESQVSGQTQTQPTQNQTQTQPAQQDATALPLAGSSQVSPSQTNVPTEQIAELTKPSIAAIAAPPSVEEQKRMDLRSQGKVIDETPKEKEYFTGKFGAALRTLDMVTKLGVGDFVDDMGRSIAAGQSQGAIEMPTFELMIRGENTSPEQIKKYVEASKYAQNFEPSDEMKSYQKIYEDEGGGIWGVVKGLAKNPSVLPEIMISSMSSMVNPASAAVVGTIVGGAAAGGSLVGGVGAIPAAAAAGTYAFGAAGAMLETASTFSELLQQQLDMKKLDFNEENVKKILEDKDALRDMRVKSTARGVTIGAIDALTGRLAGRVGATIEAGTLPSRVKAGLASATIEAAGGSAGEAAARGLIGQKMDASEIALEGLGEVPGAAKDVVFEMLRRPSYKVNGERRTESDVVDILERATPDELRSMTFDINNDINKIGEKIQNKIVTGSIRNDVVQANPDIDDESIDKIVELEKQLQTFENNKTQSGKDKAAAIRAEIKSVQENAKPKEEATTEAEAVAVTETPEQTQKREDRISEIQSIIADDDANFAETGERKIVPGGREELQTELETLKQERDAIQKPTTEESVLRTEQPEVGLPKVGEGNQEQVTAQAGVAPAETVVEVKTPEIEVLTETEKQDIADQVSALTPEQINEEATKLEELLKQQGQEPQFKMADMSEPELVDIIATTAENSARAIKTVESASGLEFTSNDGKKVIVDLSVSEYTELLGPEVEGKLKIASNIFARLKDDQGNQLGFLTFSVNNVDGTISPIKIFLESEVRSTTYEDVGLMKNLHKAMTDKGFVIKKNFSNEVNTSRKPMAELYEAIESSKTPTAELQLEAEPSAAKQEMVDEATRLMDEQEKKGFSENAFDATAPEPTVQPITIEVKENTPLAEKVKRMGLSELIGKKINLVMADQLKVGDVSIGKKMLKRMGGPFFPLIDGLFGKVAWASINKAAAASIVNGAIKSDYTVVYNMNPSAIDSNAALRETFIETARSMPKAERDVIISQMLDQLKGKKFGKKTNAVQSALSKVKNFAGFEKAISDFDVDTKAAIMNLILPSRDVKASTDIGKTLQGKGITLESLREQNIEQFVADLPAGALTMVLEVHDKNGNKVTNATKSEAIITREQQEAEGLPIHDNYPVYIRGKAVGLLKETVPFWNLLKDSMNTINVKVAEIVKKASGAPITSREARAQEMRRASMTANIAKKVVAPMTTEYEKFISLLSRSFPNVEVVTSQEQFDNLLKDLNAKQLVTKNQKIYGAVVNGKVYLNPSLENYNTPIHEFGHIWTNVVETVKPELYNKGIDLVANSEYVKRVLDNKDYQRVIDNMRKSGASEQEIQTYINKEALATAIGDKGESFVIAAQKKDFKNWLNRLYSLVKNLTGISKYTAEQLENITLEEFTKAVSVDLMSGNELFTDLQSTKLNEQLQLSTGDKSIETIIKTGLANGFSDESIMKVLEKRGFDAEQIAKAMEQNKTAGKKVVVNEEMIPGYNAVMEKISGIVAKVIGRVRNESDREAARQRAFDDAMAYLQGSKIYEDATDVQREMLVRDIRDRFYEKEKKAPSVNRLLGNIKDIKKVTMTEKTALKNQIKDLARGARDAKKAIADASKQLSEAMDNLVKEGKLTANQARVLVKKFASVNMLSPKSIGRFVDYATKVFEKADYAEKLSNARDTKKAISKLSNNKDKNADLRDLGKKFLEIDPSMVDDIDAYNEMASKIKEAIKGSTIRGKDVNFAQTVNIEDTTKYVNDVLDTQRKQLYDERVEEIKEMMGIDADGLSYEDMMGLIEPGKPITKYNEGIIRSTINKAFNTYSSIIKDMLSTGKDSFTGDDVSFSSSEKELINKFMGMDLSKLTPKQALEAVDALSNFIENKSIAKMGSVIADYNGKMNAQEIVDRGISAKPLQMYWSRGIGKFIAEQFASLPLLIEKMFKGVKAGAIIERASGLMSLKNNKATAERQANNIVTEYVDKFYKTKANGEEFNSEANLVERGLVSFMTRNIIGTDAQMKAEFDRRKKLIEQSIDALSNGNDVEKKKAELYQAAYDKLLKDANNTREVTSKADPNNLKAVMFWQEKWSDIYDKLSDVSLGIYNRRLGKDINYTPDRFSRLKTAKEKTELSNLESLFYGNTNSLYKKEAGVIMEAERPDNLPSDPDNGNPNMYIDLSFDKNNANSYYDALVDMNTASDVRQIESFINSQQFSKIVPNEDDRNILKERIQLYVRNIRGKNILESDQMNEAIRKLNTLSAIGVGQALGGITQPIKQTIPVAINTIMNAGNLKVNALFDKGMNEFMNKSGYAIANRGLESQAQIDSINKLIDLASKSDGIKALKYIENANKMWLDIFLVKPDVAIARSSWMTYYEKALKEQGIDTDNIDYSTHELNKDAADYAQSMVDRQQNVSDKDLQGKLFSSKEPVRQMFVKAVMPFANFRMNQTMRMTSDVSVLTSKTSSKEDKAIAARSLSGFAAEMFTFKMIAAGSAILLGSLAKEIMGKDEDDEDKDKRINNIIKGQATSTLTDMISPVPFLDKPIAAGASAALELTQDFMDIPADEQLSIYGNTKSDFISSLGTFGIAADRASKLYDITKLVSTGEYTDNYGVTRKISDEDADALAPLIGVSLLTNVGLAPAEVNSVVNYAVKDAKRDAKSVSEKEHKGKKDKEEKVKEIKLKKGEFGYQKPSERFGGKGFGSKTFGGK